jgi:outer membrane lipoprotein SlyB
VPRELTFSIIVVMGMGAAGCADIANTRNMAAVGTLLGAGAGVALGAATGHVGEGVMLGAMAGGLGGGLAGSHMENYSRRKSEKELLKGVQQDIQSGKDASKVEGIGPGHYEVAKKSKWVDTSQEKRVWVEEKVVDGKVIDAHFEERLIPSGHWIEEDEKVWVEDKPAQSARIP